MARKLKVAVSGLGRMGARHAVNYLAKTPRAELVAVCDPDPKAQAWARTALEPAGVKIYADFDEMLAHPGIEAVIVSGITTEHAPQSIRAIRAGKHVLCEKPLSTDVDISQGVLDVAKQHPHLKVMTGFSRRFDQSYRNAWKKADSGDIGRPVVFRSQTCDKYRDDDYFIGYSKVSGSIFVDASVHDIDLALWFFGQDSVVKSVSAVGTCARYQGLKQYGDVDNGVGIVEFWGGKIAYFYACRMMAVGQHDMTEFIGTHGKLTVNANPVHDLVEHHESTGIRKEIGQTYWDRFEPAFVRESNEFTEAVLDDKPLPFKLTGAIQALKIGSYLQEALRTGDKLFFDETGESVARPASRL
ncbi:Putative gfo/Idh/MocA-like oxidoreductase, NAD(P)-binding domain superfamily [Septoria linicola]|uniref:Gfo/Idh/MocA-like oxidoreductase, NAD(P)-binding domain superfamily n=1 Tax=Septoria linicola TaxID=215465 RepID=A0A9Q9APY8_9PEZI|nr:putative gfo/Idh/MocA-like oxidoreductase, NAD(P)-binding domain superfamily [Septoria linicola]USW52329.1 Putative gfo/Idh/MocA-like oxidoreductase, NAD(P)-binding domain superfamily [Septoria linicola]